MQHVQTARKFMQIGGASAFLAVLLGAFGAHALRGRLSAEMLAIYQTGIQYHLVHALALLFVGLTLERRPANALVVRAGWLLAGGILFFSGSLYIFALTGVRALGALAPIGGLCFLIGWLLFVVGLSRESA